MFGVRNYLGKRFQSLSVTPVNDIKDMANMLQSGGFGLSNIYENIENRAQFEDILKTYIDAVNKEPEDVDLLVLYFAGQGVQGLPRKLAKKRRLGIFLDRVGISHDIALVTGNESLFPVAKLQTILADLNSRVKRKVIILDCRFAKRRRSRAATDSFVIAEDSYNRMPDIQESPYDWDVPTVSEESLDKLTTMFTIYPTIEEGTPLQAVDSHPGRTNGFLTGCLLNILRDVQRPLIEELPR